MGYWNGHFVPLITQEKPKLVGANGAGWGGGGGWGGRIEGGMVGGKGGQRPRDCVPVSWQGGEVFFFEFFLKKKTFLPYNCLTCAFMSAMTFFFKFFSSL